MLVGLLPLLPLAQLQDGNCSVSLHRTLSGSCGGPCPGSWPHLHSGCPWGCGDDPGTMFAIRGCCAEFVCDGAPVRCCSHEHLHPTLCHCGPPPPPPVAGGVFAVSAEAPPGGDGSAARPFATIAACVAVASRAAAMSTCRVRAGVYREAVVVEAQRGVAIVGDGVGRTVLQGSLPLDGLHWQRHRGSIFRAVLPPGPLRFVHRQLFVDGEYITEARWPNAALATMLDRDASWATMKAGSGWGVVVDPALAQSGAGNRSADWEGGRATLNLGTGVFTWVRPVHNSSVSGFRFAAEDLASLKRPPGCEEGLPCKNFVGNRYFLQGVLGALDSAGEWWLNTTDWTLYVWMPDGSEPSDGRLAVKARDFCVRKEAPAQGGELTAAEQRPVRLANLSFHGCTFELLDCNNCSVTNTELLFPTYDPVSANGLDAVPAMTLVQGSAATIERVRLAYSNNAGIMLVGSGHTLAETLVESTDWLGSLAFPPVKTGFSIHKPGGLGVGSGLARPRLNMPMGTANTLRRLTVAGFGNSGIVTSQLSNTISDCHVAHGGLVGGDDACIHADNAPVKCDEGADCAKEWSRNWVHDCRK